MNKLGGIKMKNNKVRSKKREYDTYSITMELEKPLLYEEEQEEIYKRQKNIKRKSRNKKIVKLILTLLLCSVIGFFIWLSSYYAPTSQAESYLKSTNSVEVSIDNNFICFTPKIQHLKKDLYYIQLQKQMQKHIHKFVV